MVLGEGKNFFSREKPNIGFDVPPSPNPNPFQEKRNIPSLIHKTRLLKLIELEEIFYCRINKKALFPILADTLRQGAVSLLKKHSAFLEKGWGRGNKTLRFS